MHCQGLQPLQVPKQYHLSLASSTIIFDDCDMSTTTTRRGVTYFPTYGAARAAAIKAGLTADRLIPYGLGWAVQLRVSGPYAGPREFGRDDRAPLIR